MFFLTHYVAVYMRNTSFKLTILEINRSIFKIKYQNNARTSCYF